LGDLLGVGFAKRQLRKLLFYPNLCGVPKWYTTLPPSYRKQQGRIAQVVVSSLSGATASPDITVDRWVLARQVPDLDHLDATIQQVEDRLAKFSDFVPKGNGAHKVASLAAALRSLGTDIHDWLKQLPDPDILASDYKEAVETYDQAEQLLGSAANSIISNGKLTPRDLREALEVVKAQDQMAALPTWVWTPDGDIASPIDIASGVDVSEPPRL
jgi:hypothetical protein